MKLRRCVKISRAPRSPGGIGEETRLFAFESVGLITLDISLVVLDCRSALTWSKRVEMSESFARIFDRTFLFICLFLLEIEQRYSYFLVCLDWWIRDLYCVDVYIDFRLVITIKIYRLYTNFTGKFIRWIENKKKHSINICKKKYHIYIYIYR